MPSPEYENLLRQRDELDKKIKAEFQLQRDAALGNVLELVKLHALTPEDVFGSGKRKAASASKGPPKYRDPATGETWTGRGKEPTWIRNKLRANFLIDGGAA